MRFADELADLEDFKFPKKGETRPAELRMARQLVESLSAKWEPDKYTDEYKENLMRVIKGKLKGKAPRLKERESHQQADVIDLMARLRASLEGRGQKGGGAGSGAAKGSKSASRSKGTAARRTTARKRRVA
jgi:DNA end-binding protein Ku